MKKNKDKFIVQFKNNSYDLTNFLHKHPGGVGSLNGLNNMNMESRFMKGPPHSDAAMYLMKEYQIAAAPAAVDDNQKIKKRNSSNNNGVNGHVNGISGEKTVKNGEELNREFFKNDESMEVSTFIVLFIFIHLF